MKLEPYVYGLAHGCDKALYLGDRLVIKLVVFSGIASPYDRLAIQTLDGHVVMRSGEGKRSARAPRDLFFDQDSSTPAHVVVHA